MATLLDLQKLARKIVGRKIEIVHGKSETFGGNSISVEDHATSFPDMPVQALDDMDRFVTAHEASHIKRFDEEARRLGLPSLSAVEFYERFADSQSPGKDSINYVRLMLNVIEDRPVDIEAARFVGENRRSAVNRFFVWNRQGGRRPSMAQLDARGSQGMCAAFIEALFQLEVFGELIESFIPPALENAAREANRAIDLFGEGAFNRTQTLEQVLKALSKYCPPPWKLPEQYQPPASGGQQPPQQGGGSGAMPLPGSGKQSGQQGQSGQGQGAGNGTSQGQGQPAAGSGKPSDGDPEEGEPNDGEGDGKSDSSKDAMEPPEPKEKGDEYTDSEGGGSGGSETARTSEVGGEVDAKEVNVPVEKRFEDNNLEALLRMLERILQERARESGRGRPRFKTWSPGDRISAPDELQRYAEDESFGVPVLQRRVVRKRDRKKHLLALFIDSSGSVNDSLFAMLYRVCGEISSKVADSEGCYFGVGQFSGGASWMMEPTRNTAEMQVLAESAPLRMYHGSTVVGEIYKILPEWFSGYETADLIVLTDGYVEDGGLLAKSLEAAHNKTDCAIKLHGAVFKKQGTIKQFDKAKNEMPKFVRSWHLG